jgi:hypothetical protein
MMVSDIFDNRGTAEKPPLLISLLIVRLPCLVLRDDNPATGVRRPAPTLVAMTGRYARLIGIVALAR